MTAAGDQRRRKFNVAEQSDKKFLRSDQLQTRWGNCSHMFIQRLVERGLIKVYQMGGKGGTRLYDLDEIERFERASVVKRHGGGSEAA